MARTLRNCLVTGDGRLAAASQDVLDLCLGQEDARDADHVPVRVEQHDGLAAVQHTRTGRLQVSKAHVIAPRVERDDAKAGQPLAQISIRDLEQGPILVEKALDHVTGDDRQRWRDRRRFAARREGRPRQWCDIALVNADRRIHGVRFTRFLGSRLSQHRQRQRTQAVPVECRLRRLDGPELLDRTRRGRNTERVQHEARVVGNRRLGSGRECVDMTAEPGGLRSAVLGLVLAQQRHDVGIGCNVGSQVLIELRHRGDAEQPVERRPRLVGALFGDDASRHS